MCLKGVVRFGFLKNFVLSFSDRLCHQSKDSIRVRFPGSKNRQIKPSMIRYHYFPLENISKDKVALAAKLKSIHCPYLLYFIITKGPSLIEPLI